MAARAWREGRNRSFTLAVLVAFALRLAWAVWATTSISNELTDSAQYLAYAERFSGLGAPQLYGEPTAFLPPGYPLFLAPLAFVARHIDAISVNFLASLANVVLGTATVVFTALLADRWIGPAARNPAAWLMAERYGYEDRWRPLDTEPDAEVTEVVVPIVRRRGTALTRKRAAAS